MIINAYPSQAFSDNYKDTTSTPVYEDTTGDALDVYVSGGYAYVADSDSGLAVIAVSDPTNPGEPVYKDTTPPASIVYLSGDYA